MAPAIALPAEDLPGFCPGGVQSPRLTSLLSDGTPQQTRFRHVAGKK